MARKPNTYWEKRSTELMKQLEKKTEYSINQLIEVYEKATKNINKEITKIFNNYAKDTGLKKETLLRLLNSKETETHYKNLLEVINNNIADESIKKKLLAKYNAPAYAYRISRYQQLQDNIDVELKKLADIENKITQKRYVDTIQDAYYHNIYEIQKGLGIGFSFSEVDMKTINLLLNEKWIDKGNFSTRIWNNSEKLSNYFKTQFTADTMAGISIQKMSRQLNDYMNVGLYNATRLIRTEVNHFANEGEMLSYEELGIEKYRFIATLDNITCEHCAELDNRVFNVKDRKPGKNYPPIHANDRCTTVAEFDDNIEDLQRRARDENGNNIIIPQNINYKEWEERYKPALILNQGKSNNRKEKLLFQETIGDFKRNKIKTYLYSNNYRKKNIIKYEKIIMNNFMKNKRENMAILDSTNGELIGKISVGTKTTVGPRLLDYFKILTAKENSFIIIHNHPINYSISLTDIKTYVKFKSIDTMIVKSPDYTFYLKIPNRNISINKIESLYKKFEKSVNKKYSSFNGAEKRDLIISNLSNKLGWTYEKQKN